MLKNLSRQRFLQLSGVASALGVLSACVAAVPGGG